MDQTTNVIEFRVNAVPVAQPRPRAVMRGNRAGMADAPKSHAIHDFKTSVREAFRRKYQGPPLDCPLVLEIEFVMPRPGRLIWKTRPMPREPYSAKKNDWDNLGKGVCDALNKFAFTDDGLIWDCRVVRWIASGDEAPHCMVRIGVPDEINLNPERVF